MATKKQASKNTGKKVGLGMGALAAAAAGVAAGYYFYASKDAKQNRKIAAKWANDMKKDVVKRAKNVEKLNQAQLAKIVDSAAAAYETVKSVDSKSLAKAAKELKSNWKEISKEVAPLIKKEVVATKKVARKAVKTAKKAIK